MTQPASPPLLKVRALKKHFPVGSGWFSRGEGRFVRALDGVDLDVGQRETLGLVGESGCGKSTLGRVLLGLEEATEGGVWLGDSPDLTALTRRGWLPYRRRMQMIFQDPYSSLNPRMTVGDIVAEPLQVHGLAKGSQREVRLNQLFDQVGLSRSARSRFPHEFSGGQRQRIGIARALAVEPEFLVADEPVSALDVSIQAQILNLLEELRETFGLALLFISHDLSVVGHISHRVAVMYLGQLMELGDRDTLFEKPLHPYTQTLLDAVPRIETRRRDRRAPAPSGDVPSPINPPSGCPFHPRCPKRFEGCDREKPLWREVQPEHWVACRLFANHERSNHA